MPRGPVVAACLALVSVLIGGAALAVGCGDTNPSTTGGATSSSAAGASSSATSAATGGGGGLSTSSSTGGSTSATSASSSTGAGGSGGSGGAASATSSSVSGSGSSASTGGGAGSLGDPCSTGADCAMPPPNSALYCDKPGCGAGPGTCALKPLSQPGLSGAGAPVCGCDDITYWNGDYAAFHGVSVASQGACPGATAVACDQNSPCAGTMKCNRVVGDAAQCAPSAAGACWSMPLSCPLGGMAARACSNGTCQSVCDLVQSQNPWWNDASCP